MCLLLSCAMAPQRAGDTYDSNPHRPEVCQRPPYAAAPAGYAAAASDAAAAVVKAVRRPERVRIEPHTAAADAAADDVAANTAITDAAEPRRSPRAARRRPFGRRARPRGRRAGGAEQRLAVDAGVQLVGKLGKVCEVACLVTIIVCACVCTKPIDDAARYSAAAAAAAAAAARAMLLQRARTCTRTRRALGLICRPFELPAVPSLLLRIT